MRRKGFFSFYALIFLLSIAVMISFIYELKGRNQDLLNTQHFQSQFRAYEKSMIALGKVCLQKYSLPQCSFLEFSLQGYEAKIVMSAVGERGVRVDILLEYLNPLNGTLLRYNNRVFLDDFIEGGTH